jgi:hypothetical protein
VIFFSVIQTQRINNRLADSQAAQVHQQDCTTAFLAQTVEVLNERTAFSPELNAADEAKVKAEARLFGFVTRQTGNQNPSAAVLHQYQRLIGDYFDSIQHYLVVLGKTNINQRTNPYPTKEDYQSCLRGGK